MLLVCGFKRRISCVKREFMTGYRGGKHDRTNIYKDRERKEREKEK